VGLVAGGGKTKANLPASVLKEIKAMSASPAGKKAPAAAAANTASMKTSTTTKIQGTDPNRARLMKQETMKPKPAAGATTR
jgi:hypothetical protein